MPKYIRATFQGGSYIFTLVTFDRRPPFTKPLARSVLRKVWKGVQSSYLFTVETICLLPDHLHCIWRLPEGDNDFSKRWDSIKAKFTKQYSADCGSEGKRNDSRNRKGEAAVWQRRFWEHLIRNEEDFEKHFHYLHFNPVRHGYVTKSKDWKWSSFSPVPSARVYDDDWGSEEDMAENLGYFGE